MIEMRKVFFSYKAEDEIQVSDLNIEIKAGEFVLLCGKSGCGKTTILKMINGLIPHAIEGNYQGKVTIYNKSVREMETFEIAEKVGSIFQNPKTQFFNLDSDGELSFGLENMGIEPCLIKAKVQNTINELDIENLKIGMYLNCQAEKSRFLQLLLYTLQIRRYMCLMNLLQILMSVALKK